MIPEEFYTKLDPGIQSLVKALHHLTVPTISSCEGHLEEGKTPYPWVALPLKELEGGELKVLGEKLAAFNASRVATWGPWILRPNAGHFGEGIYLPVLELSPLEHNGMPSLSILEGLHQDAAMLAKFLQEG